MSKKILNNKLNTGNSNTNVINNYINKQYKTNYKKMYLSPDPIHKEKFIFPTSKKNKENTTAKKSTNKLNTPLRFDTKSKILNPSNQSINTNAIPSFYQKEETNEKIKTSLIKDTIKVYFNATNNDSQYKTINNNNTKVGYKRGGVKSLDFQVLKNFKK
jgi:hypothetical protein